MSEVQKIRLQIRAPELRSMPDSCTDIDPGDTDLLAACELLDRAVAAFNGAEAETRAGLNHYPHVRITGPKVTAWATPEDYARDTSREKLLRKGESTEFKGWTSTEWTSRLLIQRSEETMHFAVTFSRLDDTAVPLAVFESFWVLTKKDGRWGIQARSSFAGIADRGAY
jgi:hypothetical protein